MAEYYNKDEINELIARLKQELVAEIKAAKEEIKTSVGV